MSKRETIIEFPCEFPIKAMGRSDDDIKNAVLQIVSSHIKGFEEKYLKITASSNDRYISVTENIIAQNQEQLDAIYQDLSQHPKILYAL